MTAAPTVSVIIPAYNAEAFVARTLASVRAQTFTDFEAIVVDDGSTDRTAEIVAEAVRVDPRFRLIRQANGGVAAARNRALAEARGRYVANIDSDDLWRPQFLEKTLGALETAGPGAVFAFAGTQWIDEYDRPLPGTAHCLKNHVDYRELLTRNPVGNGSAMLMRASTVRAVGGYDAALVRDYGQTEDWQLLLQLSWCGAVIPVDEPLVLYRIVPNSSSHALERAARAALEVIRRCESDGPPLKRHDYWTARSLTLLWLARRAVRMRRPRLALQLAGRAYWHNPLWFTLKELRQPVLKALRSPLRVGRPPRDVAPAAAVRAKAA